MKKLIALAILMSSIIAIPVTAREKGEWSEWWNLGYENKIKRVYDKENKLVCWIYDGYRAGGISCFPSLELEHPLLIK